MIWIKNACSERFRGGIPSQNPNIGDSGAPTARSICARPGIFGSVTRATSARFISVTDAAKNMNKIKGVIYDLDGTLISTEALHEKAWTHAAGQHGFSISDQMLIDQRGMTNLDAAKMMLPEEKQYMAEQVAEIKASYVRNNLQGVSLIPGVIETLDALSADGRDVWICTSASRGFVEGIFHVIPELKRMEGKVVWREMYAKGKPAAEPLLVTLQRMNLVPDEAVYIGDAFHDYESSRNAGVRFFLFLPKGVQGNSRIPESIPRISSHQDLLKQI